MVNSLVDQVASRSDPSSSSIPDNSDRIRCLNAQLCGDLAETRTASRAMALENENLRREMVKLNQLIDKLTAQVCDFFRFNTSFFCNWNKCPFFQNKTSEEENVNLLKDLKDTQLKLQSERNSRKKAESMKEHMREKRQISGLQVEIGFLLLNLFPYLRALLVSDFEI